MAWIGNYLLNLATSGVFGSAMEVQPEQSEQPEQEFDAGRYKPSVSEVLTVKEALHAKSKLPYELVDLIVDLAEYWPHMTTVTSQPTIITAGRHREEERLILRSYPLGYVPIKEGEVEDLQFALKDAQTYHTLKPQPWPESLHAPDEMTQEVLSNWTLKSQAKGEYPCRKIVFTIKSRDQGWGGQPNQGTYTGSYTWFEAGLERLTATRGASNTENPETILAPQFELHSGPLSKPSSVPPTCNLRTLVPSMEPKRYEDTPNSFHHDMLPNPILTIQKNVVAGKLPKEYEVTWNCTDSVVPDSLDAVELEKQGRGKESGNGDLVRNMKLGDVVTVWAKARFGGWANHVDEVKLDVYWAV